MNGIPVSSKEVREMKKLRETGHSLPEICTLLRRGGSTVFKHVQAVKVLPQYQALLREKQGGSKNRSKKLWEKARKRVSEIAFPLHKEGLILFAVALYWAEGSKRDLSLTNSDPELIRIFIRGLLEIGVKKSDIRVNLRLYGDINESEARGFWATAVGLDPDSILGINWLHGKKTGKLPYGMCRIRITKGGDSFKLLMSTIEHVKKVW